MKLSGHRGALHPGILSIQKWATGIEHSEGIQPSIVKLLETLLPSIKSEAGLTVVIVEQNLELAQHTADRFLFMDKGRIVHQCGRNDLEDKSILRRYLGV